MNEFLFLLYLISSFSINFTYGEGIYWSIFKPKGISLTSSETNYNLNKLDELKEICSFTIDIENLDMRCNI